MATVSEYNNALEIIFKKAAEVGRWPKNVQPPKSQEDLPLFFEYFGHYVHNVFELDLSHKNIKILPKEVSYFTALQRLKINDNQIEELPNELVQLNDLVYIDISRNKFDCLPAILNEFDSIEVEADEAEIARWN